MELRDGGDVVNLTDADAKFPDNTVALLRGGDNLLSEARK